MKIKTIKDSQQLAGKKVILRTDYNVPVENSRVTEDYKLLASLRTLKYLLNNKAKVIIISHLGRPEGKPDKAFTLKPVAKELEKLLNKKVIFIEEPIGFAVGNRIAGMQDGEVAMLENIRFYPEELSDDRKFARELATYGDIYVNDAFAVSHRAQASVSAIKEALPFYSGLLVEEEIINLNKVLKPKKPMVAIIGGVKIKTKLPLIRNFMQIADHVLVGGILANIFLASRGYDMAASKLDEKDIKAAKKIKSDKIILPHDVIVSTKGKEPFGARKRKVGTMEAGECAYDIGPETIRLFSSFIKKAETIVWNGPLGWFEQESFKHGTLTIARIVASRSRGHAFGVVGGGETVDAVKRIKMQGYMDWVSTGGGAMLDYLSDEPMPGLLGLIKK